MTARNNPIAREVYDITKDQAVSNVTVDIDTSRWSTRKKNIIVKAIDKGVANCGYDTGWFIKKLLSTYGLNTHQLHYWNSYLDVNLIKPEKLEEVKAYGVAMIKMRANQGGENSWRNTSWAEDRFLRDVDEGLHIKDIPIPSTFNQSDKEKFIKDYLKHQDEQEQVLRNSLIDKVRAGETLSVSFEQ